MSNLTPEEIEVRKKAIFNSMSPRNQKHIHKKGYEKWDPFEEPKDPIDIRKDKTKRTTQQLVREFLHSCTFDEYSNAYGRGVVDICHGIINNDERFQGMYDFAIWYRKLLAKEGYEENLKND
ncbi:MAG: hypothetical protein JRI38_02900 [Deltaproteobacteria bacterium]|nr:hypothetical protein [Deltaproteobacteria bacterium]